jgi:sister chromatid cohesion protein PDS5
MFPLPAATANEKSKETGIDEGSWTDRLLTTMKYLDEKGVKALINYSSIKQT